VKIENISRMNFQLASKITLIENISNNKLGNGRIAM
jgi:hypothetical protein